MLQIKYGIKKNANVETNFECAEIVQRLRTKNRNQNSANECRGKPDVERR